eukprot:scaffold1903_cov396-Prasinococcus_capsulatus_cf.AAC.32
MGDGWMGRRCGCQTRGRSAHTETVSPLRPTGRVRCAGAARRLGHIGAVIWASTDLVRVSDKT